MSTGKNTILGGIVAVSLAVVLAITFMLPILSNATQTEDTLTNEGYYYMQKISADDDTLITATYTKSPLAFTYNSEPIDVSGLASNRQYTFATDGTNWVLRFTNNNYVGFQGMGASFNFGNINVDSSTITIQSGTLTASVTTGENTATYTKTFSELWLYSPEPTDYVMKKADETVYMNSDSEFYAVGATTITNWNDVIKVIGTIEDFEASVIYPTGVTSTVTNENVVYTQDNGYLDLYKLDKLTFTISDGTNTANATYSYFIVPAEITAERAVHLDSAEIALIEIIPILVIAGVILGIVGMAIRARLS